MTEEVAKEASKILKRKGELEITLSKILDIKNSIGGVFLVRSEYPGYIDIYPDTIRIPKLSSDIKNLVVNSLTNEIFDLDQELKKLNC